MISHQEAEILTSARQDAPLDPIVERELQAHLATCESCRAFAISTEQLTAGIKSIPSIPVNPRTRREVMERVRAGRNPLSQLLAGFAPNLQTGPVLAAAAMLVILGLFGWMALDRLVFDDNGGDDNNQLAAVPTEVAPNTLRNGTSTIAPTTTVAPTETVVPTETLAVEPTATETAVPTATTAPEPTATTAPEPTATEVVAETEPADEEVADLTKSDAPTETEVVEPTATTPPEPTETPVTPEPTALPTETPVTPEPTALPTETPVTPEPTAEPTDAPMPTDTPSIELIGSDDSATEEIGQGGTEAGTGSDENAVAETPAVSGNPVDTPPSQDDGAPIEPTGDDSSVESGTTPESTADVGGIEQIGPAESESTPETELEEPTETETSGDSTALLDVSESYTGIAGDPSGKLGLTGDGRMEFVGVPDGAGFTTPEGYVLQFGDAQPGVVALCSDGACNPVMEAPESDTWQGDVPLGVIGDTAYFMRTYSDRTEFLAGTPSGNEIVDATVIGETGPTSAPPAAYESDGVLYIWLPSNEWVALTRDNAQVMSGSYANPANVRFAPSTAQGPLVGYFSGGMLIVAPVTAPDAAILSIPADGVDFDIAPAGDRVAVIRGNDIVIYDIQGNEQVVYTGGDNQPTSVLWLNGGIVWVDASTGQLYQIPETARD